MSTSDIVRAAARAEFFRARLEADLARLLAPTGASWDVGFYHAIYKLVPTDEAKFEAEFYVRIEVDPDASNLAPVVEACEAVVREWETGPYHVETSVWTGTDANALHEVLA